MQTFSIHQPDFTPVLEWAIIYLRYVTERPILKTVAEMSGEFFNGILPPNLQSHSAGAVAKQP